MRAGANKTLGLIRVSSAPDMAAIRPTVGAVAAFLNATGGSGWRKDKIFRPIDVGLPLYYGSHSGHCGCSGDRLARIGWMRGVIMSFTFGMASPPSNFNPQSAAEKA